MSTKPFNIQAPEAIAKEYGGDKQRIAQAAQMGMLDPTAAVLAGMFIDRIRGAQAMEQQPQQTVAQQVFTPTPSPAMQLPGAGMPAGQAMPPQGMQPPMMQDTPQQPVMAARGGVVGLPLPNSAFNMASGGLVAFQSGGLTQDARFNELMARATELRKMGRIKDAQLAESLARQAVAPQTGFQKMYTGLGEAVTKPFTGLGERIQGMKGSLLDFLDKPAEEAEERSGMYDLWRTYDPNAGRQVPPVAPPMEEPVAGDEGGFQVQGEPAGLGALAAATQPPPVSAEQPQVPAFDRQAELEELQRLMGSAPERDALAQYYAGEGERAKGQKKEDLWSALAQMGFNMAGTDSPYFLQAVGQAGAATMPTIRESLKERRAGEEKATRTKAELEQLGRTERGDLLKLVEGKREAEETRRLQERKLGVDERNVAIQEAQSNLASNMIELVQLRPDLATPLMQAQTQLSKKATAGQQIQGLMSLVESFDYADRQDPDVKALIQQVQGLILQLSVPQSPTTTSQNFEGFSVEQIGE